MRPVSFSSNAHEMQLKFPKAVSHFKKANRWSHFENYNIAHWFLILLFLIIWTGFLAWRWRRMKRRAESRN
jgi:flagellar biogenesis protein FliO